MSRINAVKYTDDQCLQVMRAPTLKKAWALSDSFGMARTYAERLRSGTTKRALILRDKNPDLRTVRWWTTGGEVRAAISVE